VPALHRLGDEEGAARHPGDADVRRDHVHAGAVVGLEEASVLLGVAQEGKRYQRGAAEGDFLRRVHDHGKVLERLQRVLAVVGGGLIVVADDEDQPVDRLGQRAKGGARLVEQLAIPGRDPDGGEQPLFRRCRRGDQAAEQRVFMKPVKERPHVTA
jgi:hypothetical protein